MIVLASRSPRRLELLRLLRPDEPIEVCPPADSDEDPLDDLRDEADLQRRLAAIVAGKAEQVQRQLHRRGEFDPTAAIIAADTAVILDDPLRSLPQPPDGADYAATVRDWLHQMGGRGHRVLTAVELRQGDLTLAATCTTGVRMRPLDDATIDWYIATGEPRGKAGGYAVQGLGSVLIDRVEGSLSGVIGLPLELVGPMLGDGVTMDAG